MLPKKGKKVKKTSVILNPYSNYTNSGGHFLTTEPFDSVRKVAVVAWLYTRSETLFLEPRFLEAPSSSNYYISTKIHFPYT